MNGIKCELRLLESHSFCRINCGTIGKEKIWELTQRIIKGLDGNNLAWPFLKEKFLLGKHIILRKDCFVICLVDVPPPTLFTTVWRNNKENQILFEKVFEETFNDALIIHEG